MAFPLIFAGSFAVVFAVVFAMVFAVDFAVGFAVPPGCVGSSTPSIRAGTKGRGSAHTSAAARTARQRWPQRQDPLESRLGCRLTLG